MDSTDDFDLLGRSVARVLRESFTAAAETRERTVQFQHGQAKAFDVELERVLAEVRAVPARLEQERAAEAKAFAEGLADARRTIDETLQSARDTADEIRSQAVADAKAIVEGAGAEVARARELVAEERVRLDAELKALVRDVRKAVTSLEQHARADHGELLDRATTEARMILRQAHLHHRSTAKEVDRMIEAAAAEAAALRKTALADAARVAARMRGVVDVPREEPVDELPLAAWRRSAPVATAEDDAETAAAPSTPDLTVVDDRAGAGAKRRPGRRLAS
jgi:cell division septum initiation protein DivIVA